MVSSSSVACVVLAAGMAKRFGSTKQLAPLGRSGKSLIQNAIDEANESKAGYVFVVLGHDASEIASAIKPGRAQIILNKDYETGLSSSVKASVSNIPAECSGAIFMVGDQPNLTHETLDHIIDFFDSESKSNSQKKIYALSDGTEPRNPVLISSGLFPKLLDLSGDKGARDLIRGSPRDVKLIEVNDPSLFADIDVPP